MGERTKGITNLIVMVVLTLNASLTLAGKNPIPFDENTFTEVMAYVFSGLSILWSWWKNNNITDEAIEAQSLLNDLKEDRGVDADEVQFYEDAEDAEEVKEVTEKEVLENE